MDDDDQGGLTLAPEKGGAWALAGGFLAFGVAAGAITGASSADGISSALLGALFTFVGGTVLGFAGFRRRVGKDKSIELSGVRAGGALGCFSLGVVLGLALGIYARLTYYAHAEARQPAQPDAPAEVRTIEDFLHGDVVDLLRDVETRLTKGSYDEPGCREAIDDLRAITGELRGRK